MNLQKEQVVSVAIRLFAVFLFLYLVCYFRNTIPMIENNPSFNENIVPLTLFEILPILISIIFWFYPVTMARKLIPLTMKQQFIVLICNERCSKCDFNHSGIKSVGSSKT